MIGFDIVDLQFANGSKHQNDPRYHNKIFSQVEQDKYPTFIKDNTLMWVLWSMKESVYKAIPNEIQRDFNPKKFPVKSFLEKENYFEGQVEHNRHIFHCRCEKKESTISTIALKDLNGFNKVKVDIQWIESESIDLARQVLDNTIQSFLKDHKIHDAHLSHLPSGKPVIVLSGEIKEIISLSHHGHYAGFAYLPT